MVNCHCIYYRYGDIVGLQLGPDRTVILSSTDLINEAMFRDEFSDRPAFKALRTSRGETRYTFIKEF